MKIYIPLLSFLLLSTITIQAQQCQDQGLSFTQLYTLLQSTTEAELEKKIEASCFQFYEQDNYPNAPKVYSRTYSFEGYNTTYSFDERMSTKNGKLITYKCTEGSHCNKLLEAIKSNTIYRWGSLEDDMPIYYLQKDKKYKIGFTNEKRSDNNYQYRWDFANATPTHLEILNKAKLADPFLPSAQYASKLEYRYANVTSENDHTGITLFAGDKVNITASGTITLGTWAGSSSPLGIEGYTSYNIENNFKHGALLYRIGSSNWAAVGTTTTFTASKSGQLQFLVNDSDPSNNDGAYAIEIKIIKAK